MAKIKLNYSRLDYIVDKFERLIKQIEMSEQAINNIRVSLIDTNEGSAIDELSQMYNDFTTKLALQKDNIITSRNILRDYIEDTSSILAPRNRNLHSIVDYDKLKNSLDRLNEIVDKMHQAKKELDESPKWYNDKHIALDSVTKDDIQRYKRNGEKLDELSANVNISKQSVINKLDELNLLIRKASTFTQKDSDYGESVKRINKLEYNVTNGEMANTKGKDIETMSKLISKLERPEGMSDSDFEVYKEEYKKQLVELENDGWDKYALIGYGKYIKTHSTSLDNLNNIFSETKIIGSSVYTDLFKSCKLNSKAKLDLMYKHNVELKYKFSETIDINSEFFSLVNNNVINSKILEGKSGGKLFDWLHFDLRYQLNQYGAFNRYEGMSDEETLNAMRENGWGVLSGEFEEESTIIKSRYHAMLPPGYNNFEQFIEINGYDPRFNIKIMSPDGKFERVYNVKEHLFVDKAPYMYDKSCVSNSQQFINTAVNMPTYNYGYPEKTGDKNYHNQVDVKPFSTTQKSMQETEITNLEPYEKSKTDAYYKNLDAKINLEKFESEIESLNLPILEQK